MSNLFKKEIKIILAAIFLVFVFSSLSFSAVTSEEAAQLGKNLTEFGAEAAGNQDGTIPPYTGGLTTPPADFVPGSGFRPDPFADEKPLFSINKHNMDQYADKLTPGTKALFEKYSSYRVDVYKTHRTTAYPESVLKKTVENAVKTKTTHEGNSMTYGHGGIPFPIPKNGHEVMWNHHTRYQAPTEMKVWTDFIDSDGSIYSTADPITLWWEYPYYSEDMSRADVTSGVYFKLRWKFNGPVRKSGEGGQTIRNLNEIEIPGAIHIYLPGQRRVKLAPEVAFDTPSTDGLGNFTYDETWVYNGSMERYDFKLIGKKEMYVPFNTYDLIYYPGEKSEMYGQKHLNPDIVRWELRRVWVVKATLKPGMRHIYPERTFYIEEDSWTAVAADCYDAQGNMFKVNFGNVVQNYDMLAPSSGVCFTVYNLNNGLYLHVYHANNGYVKEGKTHTERWWSPDALAGRGLR